MNSRKYVYFHAQVSNGGEDKNKRNENKLVNITLWCYFLLQSHHFMAVEVPAKIYIVL